MNPLFENMIEKRARWRCSASGGLDRLCHRHEEDEHSQERDPGRLGKDCAVESERITMAGLAT